MTRPHGRPSLLRICENTDDSGVIGGIGAEGDSAEGEVDLRTGLLQEMVGKHKTWWLLLIGGSLAVSLTTTQKPSLFSALGGTFGMLLVPALLAAIPAGLFRLIFKSLTATEFLSMYTAAWVLVAVAAFATK